MSKQQNPQALSLDELQKLCVDCRLSIDSQCDAGVKEAMEKVCDRCRHVRNHLPELMALRKQLHEMNEMYSEHAG